MNALGKTNSLPLDIIDRILCFLPDYSTLQATILSSKSFYRVFETHQNSILRAVSYNVTGPALPQAIRVLRYHDVTTQAHNSDPKPWSEGDPISPITNEECHELARNATLVNALEDVFSLRHKDRSSYKSVLNSTESWKFRTAMYRLMLFADCFSKDEDEENFEDEDEDEEPDHVTVERELVARKTFLDNFVNYELFELRSAALFLIEVAKWVSVAEGNNPAYLVDSEEAVLTNGPKVIMKAYQDKSTTWLVIDIDSEAACKFLSGPLDRIWEQRKSKPPPSDSTHWTSLLDEVRGGQDTCHRCGGTYGLDLWNETNWEYLRGFSTRLSYHQTLLLAKGMLSRNLVDGPDLRQQLQSMLSGQASTYTSFFHELHQVKRPPWDTWDKSDWMCEQCITELVSSHLHLWLLERKRARGDQINEDCWYGYNCRTQTHNHHHANRVNHLCEPTR